jgi:hypothetical protein
MNVNTDFALLYNCVVSRYCCMDIPLLVLASAKGSLRIHLIALCDTLTQVNISFKQPCDRPNFNMLNTFILTLFQFMNLLCKQVSI